MRNFVFGFVAGAATYHFISGGFNNDAMVKDLRNTIQKIDDRLAEKDKPPVSYSRVTSEPDSPESSQP